MKKCDHFKGLILTDYIDGQLDQGTASGLEAHLLDCADCRAFFKEVKNNAVMPLQGALCQPVPAELWESIKQNIEQPPQSRLWEWLLFPKFIPVAASLLLMLLAGSVSLNTLQLQQSQEKDQGEYLTSLLGAAGSSAADNNDLGTPIEGYFL